MAIYKGLIPILDLTSKEEFLFSLPTLAMFLMKLASIRGSRIFLNIVCIALLSYT